MAPTEGKGPVTSSYIGSVLSALFVSCRSEAALIFVLLLIKMITVTVMKTTTLMIKVVARELIDTVRVLHVYPEINTVSLG